MGYIKSSTSTYHDKDTAASTHHYTDTARIRACASLSVRVIGSVRLTFRTVLRVRIRIGLWCRIGFTARVKGSSRCRPSLSAGAEIGLWLP